MTTTNLTAASGLEEIAARLARGQNLAASRRGLLLAPLLAALPLGLLTGPAAAIDPSETQVARPDQYQWQPWNPSAPPHSGDTVKLFGDSDKSGEYIVLMKWYPGFMSAPHSYATDRLCPA